MQTETKKPSTQSEQEDFGSEVVDVVQIDARSSIWRRKIILRVSSSSMVVLINGTM
jgi:hypothetical protein